MRYKQILNRVILISYKHLCRYLAFLWNKKQVTYLQKISDEVNNLPAIPQIRRNQQTSHGNYR